MIISCTGICCKVSIQIKWDINFIVDNFVHHGYNLNFNRLLSQSSWSIRLVTLTVGSRVYVLVTNRAALCCICSNWDIKVDCQGAQFIIDSQY